MSRADAIYASRLSLQELFPSKVLDSRIEVLIDEIVWLESLSYWGAEASV